MNILSNNLPLISDALLAALNNVTPCQLSWQPSRDGFDIPIYNGTPLHSTYSVDKESHRQLSTIPPDCGTVIAVGIGAGYHLIQLCRDKTVIAVPLNLSLFAAAAAHLDFTSYLRNVTFCDVSELYQTLYQLYIEHREQKVCVTVGSYFMSHDRQTADRVCQAAIAAASSAKTEAATIRRFGVIWHNNIQKHLRHYFDGSLDFRRLVIRDKIILAAGAGYSLTKNIGFIKKYRDRFYIAAADTASLILLRNGIVPDSVWTFDAQNISYQHFFCIGRTGEPVRIFADFCSPVHLYTQNVTTTLVFSSHPYRRIFEASGWRLRNIDSGCGNIGTAAVHFFQTYFPGLPLVTVGIDFAYYDGHSYSVGSYLDDRRMTSQDYFHSAQSFDAGITYRDKIAVQDGLWRTTPLMQGYAASVNRDNSDILTLSQSPFCGMRHITCEEVLSLSASGEFGLDFDFPNISEDDFRRIESAYLEQDKTPLLPKLIHNS